MTTAGSNTYSYDLNGNMERRTVGGSPYNLTYEAGNHLTVVSGAVGSPKSANPIIEAELVSDIVDHH